MGHQELDSLRKDKKTQFKKGIMLLGQVRGSTILIFTQASLSTRYSLSPSFSCFSFFLRDYMPQFSQGSFLYIVLLPFNPSLPSVDCVSDLLDACPIRALLEPLCVVVRHNITIQASFPHKCSQFIRCRTFNVVVVALFTDISQFIVDSFI